MDDIINDFIEEAREGLETLDLELVNLEKDPENKATLGNIFRVIHTIKGACGFLGLSRLEKVAHAGENILGKIRDDEISASPEIITSVLTSVDRITEIVDYLSENGSEPEGDDSELIDKINKLANEEQHIEETSNEEGEEKSEGEDLVSFFVGDDDLQQLIDEEEGKNTPVEEAENIVENSQEDAPMESFFKGDEELQELIDEEEGKNKPLEASNDDNEDLSQFFKGDNELEQLINETEKKSQSFSSNIEADNQDKAAEDISKRQPNNPVAKPIAKKPQEAKKEPANKANQSIRVNLGVLEGIMQMVSELVLSRNQLLQIGRSINNQDLQSSLHILGQITSELQENVMKTRMQPIGSAWSKFPRLVRDLSHDLNKKINLELIGEDTELDRQLIEAIRDPITHMVRNSCDHGIETPEERIAHDKEPVGTLKLSAFHDGGHIVINIEDDGKGINTDKIKEKALANNLATEADIEAMSHEQILQFIFTAGFSTAEKVTNVSGRGVGMDVVRTNIENIGGTICLESVEGRGSKISVKIPLTLAIISVLIVQAKDESFALPQINVREMIQIGGNSDFKLEDLHKESVIRLRGSLLPVISLSEFLNLDTKFNKDSDEYIKDIQSKFIVVCNVGGTDFGLMVDKIHNIEEIVVKPLSAALGSVSVFAGNTILGNGKIVMILDPGSILKSVDNISNKNLKESNAKELLDKSEITDKTSFLLFNTANSSPKAIPIELICRLERVNTKNIESSDSTPVLQYREKLMRLISLDNDEYLLNKESMDVIVLLYDEQYFGIPVSNIIDVVDAKYEVKLDSDNEQYIGSMVFNGMTTNLVDIFGLISEYIPKTKLSITDECNVLFVDDSRFFSKVIFSFLTDAGYNVTLAENGLVALDVISDKRGRFDVIITDLQMPDMDGFQLAENCKSNHNISNIPIIGFTSLVEDSLSDKCKKSGMEGCILKNNRNELITTIENCRALATN